MARKVTTLFIRDNSINLLVMKGKRVEKWASLLLEPGPVSQGLILNEALVAGKVKQLFKLEKVKTRKVIAGLSGVNSLYRMITLPELPEAILPEAVKHEARRVLPVSLDEVYLSYQLIPAPRGEKRVFLTAFPRNMADALLRTLRLAGLEPYIMDLAPLALSRIPDEPRAIIVNVRLEHLDIVVIADRLPQIIHRLALPGETESLSEKLPAITEEFSRTVAFYNSSHLEKPLDSTVPVFVCGELAETPESWQSLVGKLGFSVSPLPLPVEFPEGFSPNEFMVNIGLALKELLSQKEEANFSIVNFNALPEVYRPRALPVRQILVAGSIVVGIGLLVYMGFLVQNNAAQTAVLRSQLALTESHIAQEQVEIATLREQIELVAAEIKPVEAQIELVEATTAILDATLTSLEEGREEADGDLSQIVSLRPTMVNLTGVSHAGDTVTVSGIAPDENDIFTYARGLRNSGRFSAVIISSITQTEEEIKQFNFEFYLIN
jgi:type IV pilus assembly protein PilM